MLWLPRFLVVLVIAMLGGCESMTASSDYDPAVDFSHYKTYDWMPGPQPGTGDPRLDNPLLELRIRKAVEEQLAANGYVKTSDTPDFLVDYHVALQTKLSAVNLNNDSGYRPGWGWSYKYGSRWEPSRASATTFEYEEGSLILDIVEPETLQLVWRGSAQAEVNLADSQEKRETRVGEAVKSILARFPPQ